jgi:hypothetical protein
VLFARVCPAVPVPRGSPDADRLTQRHGSGGGGGDEWEAVARRTGRAGEATDHPESGAGEARTPCSDQTFSVRFTTTVGDSAAGSGDIVLQINRRWAPLGAERFWQLVEDNYFDGAPFYRLVPVSAHGVCPRGWMPVCLSVCSLVCSWLLFLDRGSALAIPTCWLVPRNQARQCMRTADVVRRHRSPPTGTLSEGSGSLARTVSQIMAKS